MVEGNRSPTDRREDETQRYEFIEGGGMAIKKLQLQEQQ